MAHQQEPADAITAMPATFSSLRHEFDFREEPTFAGLSMLSSVRLPLPSSCQLADGPYVCRIDQDLALL